jgi:hypothetical protein
MPKELLYALSTFPILIRIVISSYLKTENVGGLLSADPNWVHFICFSDIVKVLLYVQRKRSEVCSM